MNLITRIHILRAFRKQKSAQIAFQSKPPATPHKLRLEFPKAQVHSAQASGADRVQTQDQGINIIQASNGAGQSQAPNRAQSPSEYSDFEAWLPEASIAEIQERLKRGTASIEGMVAFYLERIARLDPQYNSVIRISPTVLEEARSADIELRQIANTKPSAQLKELTGVVILVKDNVAVAGMNTSAGSYALSDLRTTRHAFLVQSLVDKGALVLGKTNLSEFSNFMSEPSSNGFSTLGGQTVSAYGIGGAQAGGGRADASGTGAAGSPSQARGSKASAWVDVGGSSSGSSVATSMGFASLSIGSETAGSLIHPAGQNSVVAHKPTTGLLSRDIIVPITEAMDTAGFIGRSVADVHTVFASALAQDPSDPQSSSVDLLNMADVQAELDPQYLRGTRIGLVSLPGIAGVLRRIGSELRMLGAQTVYIRIPAKDLFTNFSPILLYGMYYDLNAFLSNPAVHTKNNSLEKIVEFNAQRESHAPYGQFYLEKAILEAKKLSPEEYTEQYRRQLAQLREQSASVIDGQLQKQNLHAIATVSNMLSDVYASAGYPAITVPSGYRRSGEPFGVCFTASRAEDFKLFQLAYSYEQGTKHRVSPERR